MRQLCVNSKVLFFGQLAQVTINVHSSIVNLQGKNCSCTEFQENSIACKHAVCAIDKRREPIMDYVHPAYLTRNLNAKKAIKHWIKLVRKNLDELLPRLFIKQQINPPTNSSRFFPKLPCWLELSRLPLLYNLQLWNFWILYSYSFLESISYSSCMSERAMPFNSPLIGYPLSKPLA